MHEIRAPERRTKTAYFEGNPQEGTRPCPSDACEALGEWSRWASKVSCVPHWGQDADQVAKGALQRVLAALTNRRPSIQ